MIGDPQQTVRMFAGVAEQLARVPGVTSVGLSSSITMDGEDNGNYVAIEEFPDPQGRWPSSAGSRASGPGYFETMGIRLVAGRSITWSDIYEQRPVIVISEPLAREYLGRAGEGDRQTRPTAFAAVPVARNHRRVRPRARRWVDRAADGDRLLADAERELSVAHDGLRGAVDAGRHAWFLRELEQAVWSVNPNLPLATVQTLEEIQASSMTQTSFALVMLGIAASVALLIGMVGIYGVVAYAAAQRTREIGVRMALGAQAGDVRTLFLRQGLWLTAIGIAIGAGIAFMLTRVMSAFLFGVGPMDPITYAAVSLSSRPWHSGDVSSRAPRLARRSGRRPPGAGVGPTGQARTTRSDCHRVRGNLSARRGRA